MIRLPIEGEEFGRYRLLRKLGQGGMGVVYAAHDTTLDREVAVKLVIPHLAGDEGFRARFQHEAATLARLESPRIVRIYDHGQHEDVLFLVTQLVAGGDLQSLIQREGALPPALATSVLTQVLEGLGDAHAVSVVHRDIKPANVLLRERGRELEAFLCDFGIATTPGADLSRTGAVAGSLPYMAPERHQGEDAGPQGDIYAAGCLFWHALTGSAPYAGTDVEVAVAHMQAPIPQLPGKDEFSQAANAVIRRAMAKDRRKRYPTARAMLTELTRLSALAPDAISLPGATAIRQPVVIGTRPRRWAPAAVAVAAILAVIGTAVVAGGAIGSRNSTVADPPTVRPDPTSSSAPSSADGTRGASVPDLVVARPVLRPLGARIPTWTGKPGSTDLLVDALPPVVAAAPTGSARVPVPGAPAPGATAGSAPGPAAPAPGTGPAPAPAPTTQYVAPQPRWRCWNGVKRLRYADCTVPVGRAGADWLYPDFSARGCVAYNIDGTRADREAWICNYNGPDGGKNWITFARWTTQSAMKSHHRGQYNYNFSSGNWIVGGADYGTSYLGRYGPAGSRRWRQTKMYAVGNWSFHINAATLQNRNRAYQLVDQFRRPGHYRGVPL